MTAPNRRNGALSGGTFAQVNGAGHQKAENREGKSSLRFWSTIFWALTGRSPIT